MHWDSCALKALRVLHETRFDVGYRYAQQERAKDRTDDEECGSYIEEEFDDVSPEAAWWAGYKLGWEERDAHGRSSS